MPPGLQVAVVLNCSFVILVFVQEHEDSLSKDDGNEEETEELNETGDGSEVLNEDLLDEDEDDGDEERSWKRRNNDED